MNEERITSRNGTTFKNWLSISRSRTARPDNLIFLEGLRLCADAAASGAVIEAVLQADSAGPSVRQWIGRLPEPVRRFTLPDHLFAALCDTEHPQGLALIARSPAIGPPYAPPDRRGLYLVAEELQDPGNLGALIRTADAFAFDAVIVVAGSVWPANPKVLRAAMGSCFHIPLLIMPDIAAVAAWLAPAGIPLLAADPAGRVCGRSDWPAAAALVIGNEARGLSGQAVRLCSLHVRIPMPGRAESLNAAAAAAILSYELMLARSAVQIKLTGI